MATVNGTSIMQTTNLAITPVAASHLGSRTVQLGVTRVLYNATLTTRSARRLVVVAAGNPERIDNFVDGARKDASQNAKNFGNQVADAFGNAQETAKDVGRDMGAKAQEAVDQGSKKVDEAGDKARDVAKEVRGSTEDTLNAAKANNGQSVADKAQNAASNVGDNLKQNFDYGTGAVQNAADDASKNVKDATNRNL